MLTRLLGSGELFGLSSVSKPSSYMVNWPLRWAILKCVPFRPIGFSPPFSARGDLAVEFIEYLARQLNRVWMEGSELFSEDCRARVIRKLIEFASSPAAQPTPGGR